MKKRYVRPYLLSNVPGCFFSFTHTKYIGTGRWVWLHPSRPIQQFSREIFKSWPRTLASRWFLCPVCWSCWSTNNAFVLYFIRAYLPTYKYFINNLLNFFLVLGKYRNAILCLLNVIRVCTSSIRWVTLYTKITWRKRATWTVRERSTYKIDIHIWLWARLL